jgi:hypothetical protein
MLVLIYFLNNQFVAQRGTVSAADVDYDKVIEQIKEKIPNAVFLDCWPKLNPEWVVENNQQQVCGRGEDS